MYDDLESLAKLKIGRAIDRLSKENAERTAKINSEFASRGLSRSGPFDSARLRSHLQAAEEACREAYSIWLDLIMKRDQVLTKRAVDFIIARVEQTADGFRKGIQSSMSPPPENLTAFLDNEVERG